MAAKLLQAVSSVMDCFELAREFRTLDMWAAPYDLTALGLGSGVVAGPRKRQSSVRETS